MRWVFLRWKSTYCGQLGALGLVVNIIVLWNTMYLDAALSQLRKGGYPVRDEDVARLSPFVHERHINLLALLIRRARIGHTRRAAGLTRPERCRPLTRFCVPLLPILLRPLTVLARRVSQIKGTIKYVIEPFQFLNRRIGVRAISVARQDVFAPTRTRRD